jgi:hypothetical protein
MAEIQPQASSQKGATATVALLYGYSSGAAGKRRSRERMGYIGGPEARDLGIWERIDLFVCCDAAVATYWLRIVFSSFN